MSALVEITVGMSLILGLGFAALVALRRHSAAARHWVLTLAIVSAGLVAVLTVVSPGWVLPRAGVAAGEPHADAGTSVTTTFTAIGHADARPSRAATPSAIAPLRLGLVGLSVWLLGAIVNLAALGAAMRRLARLASRAAMMRDTRWTRTCSQVSRMLGLTRPVTLLQSDHPTLLVTWGHGAPAVFLPRSAPDWTDERVRIVLTHELAHVARADWLVQVAAEAVRCVFWFNPLVWIACGRLRREGELACDDAVVRSGVRGDTYATHLLELARAFRHHPSHPFPAPAMAGRPSTLEGRITAMLNTRLNRRPVTRLHRGLLALAALIVTLPIAALAQGIYGSVSGVIVDPTARALPNVEVAVVDTQRNVRHELRTDRRGRFDLVGLPAGAYAIEASIPGFVTGVDRFTISGQAVERNLELAVGSLEETVMVTGQPGTVTGTTEGPSRDAPPTQACAEPTDVGGNIRPPMMLRHVRPGYPGVNGGVTLAARIGRDGSVVDLRVIQSDRPELEGAALAAVSQWQYTPTLLNCAPVEVGMTVQVQFRQEQ